MNKIELTAAIAEETGLNKKDAGKAVDAFMGLVTKEVADGRSVQLIGFGTFDSAERAARTGKNPQTGAAIEIPAKQVPRFRAGKAFKEAVAR